MILSHTGVAARLRRTIAFAAITVAVAVAPMRGQGIPDRISDADFWKMFTDFSEAGGTFASENLLSNETGFQNVIPELLHTVKQGGVYFGVGPEQNFTYIVALHPKLAFITDIRHQNAVYHLLYKALIEMSDNRADFVAKLFSRPRPAGLNVNSPVDSIFAAFALVKQDSMMYYRTLAQVKDRLMKDHHFALTTEDLSWIDHNFDMLYQAGPGLSYNFNNFNGRGGGNMPDYAMLMQATDLNGVHRSYLATDSNYQVLRSLEMSNLLIPLTGNFAGPKALRAAGNYVREHGATVTTFYASNVEQYLFQNGIWFDFEANIASLPLDSTSTFIRSGRPNNQNPYGGGGGGPGARGGMGTSLLQSMMDLVKATNDKKIQSYQDVLTTSH